MRHHPLLWLGIRGNRDVFPDSLYYLDRVDCPGESGTESRAQYDLDRGYYLPPHANSGQPDRPASYGEGADEPGFGRAICPGSPATGRDSGIVGSTRGDVGSLASLPPEVQPETGPAKELPNQLRRALIDYYTKEAAGTIIVDTPNTYLYFVLGNGKALRYGIGVGREGFTWSGSEKISRMAEWPDWNPPEQMIERQPYLPRFMAGGEGNPLGRAHSISAIPCSGSMVPISLRRSELSCPRAASGLLTKTSPTSTNE